MKIKGTQLVTERATMQVAILRPGGKAELNLTLRALPLGFEETTLQRLPSPRPPRRFALKDGKVLRDGQGTPIQEPDSDNPEYRRKLIHTSFLQMIAFVHEALRGESSLEWETPEPKGDDGWEGFYEGILREMRAANLTTGDIKMLMEKSTELSNIKEEDIAAARERFLPGGREEIVPAL